MDEYNNKREEGQWLIPGYVGVQQEEEEPPTLPSLIRPSRRESPSAHLSHPVVNPSSVP